MSDPRSPQPHSRKAIQSEAGATAVLVALMLTVLLAFVGLAIDGSNAYTQQQRMQIAADAAVLAGARLLALGESAAAAQSEAQTLGTLNGADAMNVAVVDGGSAIEATATRTFDTFFARIVGPEQFTVRARARAGFINVGRAGNLIPLTTQCPAGGFTYGQTVSLMDGKLDAPGNFGWLSWDGSNSASTLAANIEDPSRSPTLSVGDWVETATGATYSHFVRAALNILVDRGQPVTIALFDQVTGNGNNTRYRVCGFAQFVILSHSNKNVTGRFVRNVIPGEEMGGAVDLGTRDIRIQE